MRREMLKVTHLPLLIDIGKGCSQHDQAIASTLTCNIIYLKRQGKPSQSIAVTRSRVAYKTGTVETLEARSRRGKRCERLV